MMRRGLKAWKDSCHWYCLCWRRSNLLLTDIVHVFEMRPLLILCQQQKHMIFIAKVTVWSLLLWRMSLFIFSPGIKRWLTSNVCLLLKNTALSVARSVETSLVIIVMTTMIDRTFVVLPETVISICEYGSSQMVFFWIPSKVKSRRRKRIKTIWGILTSIESGFSDFSDFKCMRMTKWVCSVHVQVAFASTLHPWKISKS